MLKIRLIPILLLREGMLVKSIEFKRYLPVGNPKIAIEYFNSWEVDEIIFLDITPNKIYQEGRKDINLENFSKLKDYTKYISKKCFVPLTVGGGIRSISNIRTLLQAGADKISINTQALENPKFINKAARTFGSQCIVISIDVTKHGKEYFIVKNKKKTSVKISSWVNEVIKRGAGEILLQSVDKDGTQSGYDLSLLKKITKLSTIPIIAASGVGEWQDLVDGVVFGGTDAVAAANIFHYTEQSTRQAKKYLKEKGIDIR